MQPGFRRRAAAATLAALAAAPLLHSPTQPWDEWFRALGQAAPDVRRGPGFSEAGLLLRAAADGLGVALARSVLVQPELEAGRLVRPVPHSVPAAFAYYVVYPADAPITEQLAALRDWLLAQAKTPAAEAGAGDGSEH